MNATVVLCHFCEQHGPSVVMCTQPYRQVQSRSQGTAHGTVGEHLLDPVSSISRNTSHLGLSGLNAGEVGGGGGLDQVTGAFAFGQDSAPAPMASKNSPTTSQQLPVTTNPSCRACSFSSRDEPGLISQDQAAGMTFISTQWPKDQDLLTYVRVACQRSLSCEVFPEPEGAFYFGDEVNGHVISYNFQVKDSQARGFQSRFSILVMSWDRVYLLTLWPFLISNLSRMVARIRLAAEHTYETEISNATQISTGAIGGPSPSTHRVSVAITTPYGARGATPPQPPAPIPSAFHGQAVAAGTAGPNSGVVRQRRAADADMRSLADLTKDDQIFYRIHAWFTWLLRAGGRRWSVIPSLMTPPDEDALIEKEERQSAIAAMGELSGGGQLHPLQGANGSGLSTAVGTAIGFLPGVSAVDHTGTSIGGLASPLPGLTDDGSSVEETTVTLLVLTRMLHSLGEKAFGQLVQHIAVGNQLVVQPTHETALGRFVVSACAKLLPRGCRKQVVLSPDYIPPFQCNLLSLTVEAMPPEPGWNPGEGVLFVSVTRLQTPSIDSSESTRRTALNEFVDSLHFKIGSVLPSVDPLLASVRASSPAEFSPSMFQALPTVQPTATTLSTYAQHVVKLLSLDPPLPPSSLDLAIRATRQEWINRARLLYSFKRCQGPIMTAEETTRRWAAVLAAIDCTSAENANVARFWQGALSQHSRQNTCHSRRRTTNSSSVSRKSSRCSSTVDLAAAALAASSLID